jgi:hypothetical protein
MNSVVRRAGATLRWGSNGPEEIVAAVPGTRLLAWVSPFDTAEFKNIRGVYRDLSWVMTRASGFRYMAQYHRYAALCSGALTPEHSAASTKGLPLGGGQPFRGWEMAGFDRRYLRGRRCLTVVRTVQPSPNGLGDFLVRRSALAARTPRTG